MPTGANYITFTNLILDGRNSGSLPSPAVNGDHAVFRFDEITNYHTAICFQLGNPGWGTTARDDHRLESDSRLRDVPGHQHGARLLCRARRLDADSNNYIYKNADRGVQLYPSAQGSNRSPTT